MNKYFIVGELNNLIVKLVNLIITAKPKLRYLLLLYKLRTSNRNYISLRNCQNIRYKLIFLLFSF